MPRAVGRARPISTRARTFQAPSAHHDAHVKVRELLPNPASSTRVVLSFSSCLAQYLRFAVAISARRRSLRWRAGVRLSPAAIGEGKQHSHRSCNMTYELQTSVNIDWYKTSMKCINEFYFKVDIER